MPKAKGTVPKKQRKKTDLDEKTFHEMIEKKAYEIHEKRGRQHGKDLDDWLEAEKIVKGELSKGQ
jgi:DUF2934 family protein